MKQKLFSIPLLSLLLLSVSAFVKISSGGIIGRTGSPGETTCSACHGGGAGVTSVAISASPAFISGQYQPGQTYIIDVVVSNSSFSKFGFNAEILTLANTNSGTMTTAFSGVQFANSGARKNATHTAPKTGLGTSLFQFEWIAPASGTTKIYAAGNAIDGTGSTGADTPGSTNITLTSNATSLSESSAPSVNFNLYPNPVITDFRMQYTLVSDGIVKAILYNLRGQEIDVLLNENQTVGLHSISASLPKDLQAGIYMVKLSINNMPYSQRMLVKQ